MSGKQNIIAKFMKVLSSVEGFPLSHEDLQEFAHKISAETGVKPTKSQPKAVGYGAVEKGKAHEVGVGNERASVEYFNSNPDSPIKFTSYFLRQ